MNFLALVTFILVLVFSVLRRTAEESRRVGRRTLEPPPVAPLSEVLGPPRSLNPYRPVAPAANRGR